LITPKRRVVWARAGCASCAANRPQQGVLAREREMHALARTSATPRAQGRRRSRQRSTRSRRSGKAAEPRATTRKRELYGAHRKLAELSGQLQSQKGRIEAAGPRGWQRIDARDRGAQPNSRDTVDDSEGSRARLAGWSNRSPRWASSSSSARARRGAPQLLEQREEARMEAREAREPCTSSRCSGVQARRASLVEQAVARMEAQRADARGSRQREIARSLDGWPSRSRSSKPSARPTSTSACWRQDARRSAQVARRGETTAAMRRRTRRTASSAAHRESARRLGADA
jgi:chromosome segregation protein